MPESGVRLSVRDHYSAAVGPWQSIMGEHLHVGFFQRPGEPLEKATEKLVMELSSWGEIGQGSRVLDVGCGTGAPARLLCRQLNVRVLGLCLTQEEELFAGRRTRESDLGASIRVEQRDILDGPPDRDGFDVAWLMESSHLIRDRNRLFETTYGSLKVGGRLLLCDFTLRRPVKLSELFQLERELKSIEASFGRVKNETLEDYEARLRKQGYLNLEFRDVTEAVRPTPRLWKERAWTQSEQLVRQYPRWDVESFIEGCEAMESLFDRGILGYGFIRADKGEDHCNA